MYEQIARAAPVDIPLLVADFIVDTGLLDRGCRCVGGVLKALPSRLATWFGPELKTPANSAAPSVEFRDGEIWNGVIFVETGEPVFWLLVKAGPDRRPRGFNSQPFGDSQGARTWHPTADPPWDETFCEPWEREPWRR